MPSRRQRPLLALPLLLRLLEPPHQSHQLVEGLVNVHPELGAALDVRRAEVLGKADDLVLVDLQRGGMNWFSKCCTKFICCESFCVENKVAALSSGMN